MNAKGKPISKIGQAFNGHDHDAGGAAEPLEWPAFGDLIDILSTTIS